MTNEEFQTIVLEELKGLRKDVDGLKERLDGLDEKLDIVDKKIDEIYEQTADLTEFKEETAKDIKIIKEDNRRLKEIVGRHEIEIKILQKKLYRHKDMIIIG